ncbi:uncharacterized protein ACLA_047350 [Aspergillus clavatus NRRL 1]|uniref:N-acetyltransferase domain-containing protein n=1 Tax=Aspergillus clavatus (strain ATCC 1007 / CBS 513.65 / DSM 816 / NCTC 3887 / NRRL 1 / QM 1276 / 107) TaxID=344612 RepID=A1CHB1_ASPCL|nr:uncharacterized protein ACLA_047350 [Aspergillus clavatus NRRL 1]EAW10266.1 hypothetical protein ACLA_047350 [Aspergillus clavatus NRRL 1]
MKDEEIQAATASEPLSLEEEYAMQQSWRLDPDKLTFIVCAPLSASAFRAGQEEEERTQEQQPAKSPCLQDEDDAPARMLGDINLFLRLEDDEEGAGAPQLVGEVELMIAEKASQGKGHGRAALLGFLRYVVEHEGEILREFAALSVKIGKGNGRSLALFESVGFVKVSEEPNYFGEFELRRTDLGGESVQEAMGRAGVSGYTEVVYKRAQ